MDLKHTSQGTAILQGMRALQVLSHETAREKGWWGCEASKGGEPIHRSPGELLMLVVSELSEALECWRDGESLQGARPYMIAYDADEANPKPMGFAVELADAVIRIADLCERHGIDLGGAILAKIRYNKTREYRHGNKVA